MIRPEKQFYIFGMGPREKYIYKEGGELIQFSTGRVAHKFDIDNEKFLFDRYMVVLWTKDKKTYKIYENENGVYIRDISNGDEGEIITLTESEKINLPDFEEYKYPEQLRILHAEILTSFLGNDPVPNIYVYKKPWYRDGAMMALALEKTGNLHLIKNWALSVTELYDRNNKGNMEPDNLGQLAYVLSHFVDKSYPLINKIVEEAKSRMEDGVLTGLVDYNHHEVYANLWLRLALERLDIDTSFIKIPKRLDSYARMFWMDKRDIETEEPFRFTYDEKYPYLTWALWHFRNDPVPKELLEIKYPMSHEIEASEAIYENIAPLSLEYAKNKCGAPHSWHASEMFAYLIEMKK